MYGVWGARERESTADKNGENKEEQHKNGQTKIGRKTPNSVYTHKNWFTQLHSDLGRIRY